MRSKNLKTATLLVIFFAVFIQTNTLAAIKSKVRSRISFKNRNTTVKVHGSSTLWKNYYILLSTTINILYSSTLWKNHYILLSTTINILYAIAKVCIYVFSTRHTAAAAAAVLNVQAESYLVT